MSDKTAIVVYVRFRIENTDSRFDGVCESENNILGVWSSIWISFALLHARILYARITRRVMRVLLPLNAVPLFSLRASHEALNRTDLTVLNRVNHGFKKPSCIFSRVQNCER